MRKILNKIIFDDTFIDMLMRHKYLIVTLIIVLGTTAVHSALKKRLTKEETMF